MIFIKYARIGKAVIQNYFSDFIIIIRNSYCNYKTKETEGHATSLI